MDSSEIEQRLEKIAGEGWAKVTCGMKSGTKWTARIKWNSHSGDQRSVSACAETVLEALEEVLQMWDSVTK